MPVRRSEIDTPRPPRIRDVAELSGTSVAAVSVVLTGKSKGTIRVSEETERRIREAARKLNYTPNPVARGLATGRCRVLGLVFPYSRAFTDRSPFCTELMTGVFEEAIREQYNVMLHTAVGEDWYSADTRILADPRADGLILTIPRPNSEVVSGLIDRRYPLVTVVYDPGEQDVCSVNADEYTGGRLAAEHLVKLGHKRIAHLAGLEIVATSEPRKRGFLSVMEEAGLEVDPALVPTTGFSHDLAYERTAELLALPRSRRPTAVFAANDLAASGCIDAVRDAGLVVPDDIAVVGYDDTWFAEITSPKLTSVHMPIYEMGMEAAKILTLLVEGKAIAEKRPVLPVFLTVRESCGAKR